MMMNAPDRRLYVIQLFTCSLMWSSGFIFMKLLAGSVDPFAIASTRAGIAAVILSLWFSLRGHSPLPSRRELVPWLMLGTLNGWLPNVLTAFALEHAAAGPSAMIQASGPLMVAVLSHIAFADERLTLRRLFGVLIGFVGITLLIGPAAFAADGSTLLGSFAMVIVSLCYALGNVYAKFIPHVEPARMALGQQVISASVATLLALGLGGISVYGPIIESWPAALALSIFSTAMPITIFMYLIRQQGPTKAAMIGYLMPVFAVLLSVIFLGETIGLREIAGGVIVLFGVAIVSTAPRARVSQSGVRP
jgi:drug/metabolite transporter (DMT)-like permease